MEVDDFEAAYESAVAADAAGTLEPATDFGRNAKVSTGDEEIVETDGVSSETSSSEVDNTDVDSETDVDDDIVSGTETFEWSDHKDKLVTVKVNGEEIRVPLAEAMSSYMRQADYTKKTQALAEVQRLADWGREFQEAIQNDPAGTIRALQQALDLGEPEVDPYADLDPELQPIAAQLRAQEAQIAQFNRMMEAQQQQVVLEQVKAEVASVRAKYNDFDAAKVLPLAANRGLSVEEAYKLIKADEYLSEQANRGKAEASAKAKAEVAARKRAATEQVSRGGSSTGEASGSASAKDFSSFEEMLEHNLQIS